MKTVNHGDIMRIQPSVSDTPKEWDLNESWYGTKLTHFRVDYSTWTKTKTVKFFRMGYSREYQAPPEFLLYLDETTPEDVAYRIGESYLLLLNSTCKHI